VTRWLTLLVLVLSLGCDGERGSGGTVVPDGRGTDSGLRPEGDPEGESMAELNLRLDNLVAERANLGSAVTSDPNKCEELCELSRAICEVKTKMCTIADSQAADEDYQDLCRKAKQRCSDASDSCVRCVERSEGRNGASCEGEPAGPTK
jgi:hypothetical protein